MLTRPPADLRRATLNRVLPGAALLLALGAAAAVVAAQEAAPPSAPGASVDPPAAPVPPAAPPSAAEIDRALKDLRADPALAGERTERTLRLKRAGPAKPRDASAFEGWLREFFAWLGEAGRVLVWALGAAMLAFLLWFLARALVERQAVRARRLDLPSHVGGLDISPDSLPDDVGAAAWALWQRGERRAALSLLYRGALSRLVHDFAVPIKAASTESECVALTRQHATSAASTLFAELVGVWQPAVYGARMPAAATVQRLCHAFGAVLTAPTADAPDGSAAQVAG